MRIFLLLFLMFTALPFIEIYLMVKLSKILGFWYVIGLAVVTGFIGAGLAKWQGAGAIKRLRESVKQGGQPAKELFDGFLILIAGVVLITPGLITDCFGFILLIPPFRSVIREILKKSLLANAQTHIFTSGASFSAGMGQGVPPRTENGDVIIDAEGAEMPSDQDDIPKVN